MNNVWCLVSMYFLRTHIYEHRVLTNLTFKFSLFRISVSPTYYKKNLHFHRTVNNYVVFHVLSAYSSFLTEDVIELKKNLTIASSGTYKKYERWRRCVSVADGAVGFALGALFVKRNFKEDSYKVVSTLSFEITGTNYSSNCSNCTKTLSNLTSVTLI